jgi:hypothetical protein
MPKIQNWEMSKIAIVSIIRYINIFILHLFSVFLYSCLPHLSPHSAEVHFLKYPISEISNISKKSDCFHSANTWGFTSHSFLGAPIVPAFA